MGRLAVILGSNALAPGGGEIVAVAEGHGAAVLQRHGIESYTLPHLIDHAANLRSLVEAGCDRALAIGSVGSLRPELEVGSFVCPNDFISLGATPTTFDDARAHSMPGFDPEWRGELISAWSAAGAGALRDDGIYWQTSGPRFETPAEIRLIAGHADVVGMTPAARSARCRAAGADAVSARGSLRSLFVTKEPREAGS